MAANPIVRCSCPTVGAQPGGAPIGSPRPGAWPPPPLTATLPHTTFVDAALPPRDGCTLMPAPPEPGRLRIASPRRRSVTATLMFREVADGRPPAGGSSDHPDHRRRPGDTGLDCRHASVEGFDVVTATGEEEGTALDPLGPSLPGPARHAARRLPRPRGLPADRRAGARPSGDHGDRPRRRARRGPLARGRRRRPCHQAGPASGTDRADPGRAPAGRAATLRPTARPARAAPTTSAPSASTPPSEK